MKLHLPHSLRKALMAVLASSAYFTTAEAGCMHAGVSPTIYTDFGQNMGRYSVYQVNELLSSITERNGILIPYTTGAEPGRLEHKMISFEGMNNDGAFTAVGYNYTATVAHNGCPNPSFTPRYIGDSQAIHYQGVEYRSSENNAFLLKPNIDYKVTRSSKIFTDITASGVFDTRQYLRDGGSVLDLVHYRAGAGSQEVADFDGHTHGVAGGYAYITGGVVATLGFNYANGSYDYNTDYEPGQGPRDVRGVIDDPYTISVHGIQDYGPGGAGQPTPDNPKVYLLPFVSRGGDSGSPVWAWDAVDEEYKLISCHQARGGDNSYSRGASQWTIETMESFNKDVDMETAGHTVTLHEVRITEESEEIYDATNKVGTTTQFGDITGADDAFAAVSFCGVGKKGEKTIYTWLSLYDQKDKQNWYSYGNTYFNANGNGSGKDMHLGDLFNTENIVFKSDGSGVNNIVLDADIDMGIGYAQFTTKEDGQHAIFNLKGNGKADDGRDYMLNSAGYIVDEGAELHIQVTNTQKTEDGNFYYREWRKQGAGDMYLEGTGNNEIFLNLGGTGTTYLREQGGYAAYNVLINNGATVNFNGDITQIARDVTFGNGGGYLEFSGLDDFYWRSGENANIGEAGFTINALTQDATLINSTDSTTLHYMTGGSTTFLGSFRDTANSILNVVYEGGGTWTLNSIHTKLHDGSKFTVANGTVELVGTNTVHALGSIEGKANTRYSHPDDWHYADSAMNVEVEDGAIFRLGSHARLTGNVTVQDGGTLEMAEGVKHRYEYIEGWLIAEDTYDPFYREYYGLKGDVTLNGDSTLRFNYSSGTDAENVYGGNITGTGNVDMQLGGSGATLVLSGNNDFTGTKHLSGGGLVVEHENSLGDTTENKWLVNRDAFIAVKGLDGNEALKHIDTASTGVIALAQSQTEQVDLTEHTHMIVGALAGDEPVQYGTAPVENGHKITYTTDKLTPVELEGQRKWQLGGGGGELVVNFLLEDAGAELVLGNEYTTGTVTLTNIWNQIGSINFAGQVTLNYTSEEALGGSKISLGYTNRVIGSPSLLKSITRSSDGVLLLDKMPEADVDLTDHHFMALGSDGDMVYSGNITPTAGGYRFGGITGTLELQTALTDGEGESRGLMVDAQGYAGGTLALATKATLTGDIVVTGHDTDRHPEFSGGDISLRLDTANAITSASRITVKEGGSIDVNGTPQTFHGFNMEAGSALVDTSELWSGSAVVDVAAGATSRLEGNVDVYSLTKTGQGDMVLGGSNNYGVFFINEGRVLLENGNALSATGTAMLEKNGVLDVSNVDISAAIGFAGGTLQVGTKSVAGSLAVATGYDGTVQQNAANITTSINSGLQVAEGATLRLSGEHGNFNFSAEEINENGGTIALEGNRIAFTNGKEMTIGGIVSLKAQGLSESERVTLYSDGSSDNMIRNINELHIVDGQNAAIQEASWNTIWNIHSLTGSGDLKWVSNTTHWYSARVVLDGANSFDGLFTAERTYGNVSNRSYQSFVEAKHDLAMQNMDVSVIGKGAQSNMALAVNTEDLHMRSLSGNEHALLYAGASVEGADHDKDEPLKAAPESTRRATLTITGRGIHTFSGNVTGQDHYIGYETKEDGTQVKVADVTNAGISIVMDGQGKQIFNGAHTRFNSVTVNSGVLELASADLTIKENVTITRDAELQLSRAYTLDSGKTLTVLANEPRTSARLSGGLVLNGGTLTFSAEGLSDSAPALLIIGSLSGSSVTLNFTETHAFTSDVRYHLADQDWSDIHITDATEGLTYLTASYQTDVNGLYVSFTTKEGNLIWGGTDDNHDWSSHTFGPSGLVPTSDQTAVFNDAAANHHVNITDDVKVTGLVFDAAGDYELASEDGFTVTAGNVVQSGSGTTTLTDAVRVGSDQSHGTVTVTNGELRVTDEAVLQNVDAITGGGTLGVDFGEGHTGTVFALFAPDSSVGALHVVSGTFEASWTPCYASLLLDAGAGYAVGAEQTLAYVQVGQGEGGAPATLNLGNRTLTAAMVVMQGDLSISGNGGELHADITGGHTITTSGTVTLRGSNFDGNLHVQSGTLNMYEGANTHVAGITMDADTTLYLGISTGLEGGATIHMGNNASLRMTNGAGGSHIVNANIVMDGSSASLYGTLNGNSTVVRGSIEGHGTLSLKAQDTYWNNSWSIESLLQDGEGGALALSSDGNVTLSGANTYSGGTTITGNKLTTNNERALGTGTLNMTAGELVLKKDLTVGGLSGSETASINLGTKRLTVDSNGVTRFSGEISNGSLAKLGSGTLEIEVGGELDNISVGCGTLDLGDCAVSGNLSVAAGTTLDFTGDMLRLSHAVDNAGTFNFCTPDTSIEIENGSGFDIHTDGYLDVNGNKAENGFAQGLTIRVFENTGDGQIAGIAPEVAYMGDTLTLDLATGVASRGASTTAYSVRTGTVVYDDAFAAKAAAKNIQNFSLEGTSLDAPATLRLARNLEDGMSIVVSNYGGNLQLDQGVLLSERDLDVLSLATLTGSGTFALNAGNVSLPGYVLLGNDAQWTGAVRISDMSLDGTNITGLANSNSYVEMYGITGGHLSQWQGTLATNIRLTDTESGAYAWKWTNGQGSGASTITFTGKWEGNGTFAQGGANKNQNYTFKGDISDWSGKYLQLSNSSVVTFARTGEQQVVSADFERRDGTLNLIVGNGSAATNAEFHGSLIDVSSLQVKAASTATLAGERNTLASLTVENNATLTNTGSTVLTGSLTNNGTISNSATGNLNLGDLAASVGNITNAGTLTIGTMLTGGTIDNTGDIIISSLMEGTKSDYIDAHGHSGDANPSKNGFATTTLTVRDVGATITGDGRIYYAGNDVTSEVMNSGVISSRVNYGTYYINATDNTVAYSNIAAMSGDSLEFVYFKEGADLKVDNGESSKLRTSQVKISKFVLSTPTLSMQNDATLVVDESTTAKVNASSGSTITLELAAATPETRLTLGGFTPSGATVNVTGSGVLDLDNGQYGISTLNITGGTVYTEHSGNGGFTQHNTVNINEGGTLQLDNVDAIGYGGGATSTINLHGAANDYAVLELGGRQTYQSTVINMQGNAEVRAMAYTATDHQRPMIDPFNSQQTINASDTNNLIAVPLRFRHDLKVQVESGGELTLAGGVYYDNESSTPRTITKTGAGKLVFDEPRVDYGQHNYTGTFALSEGSAEIKADATFNTVLASASLAVTSGSTTITTYTGSNSAALSVSRGAQLAFNGNATLASAISNSGAVTFGNGCTELTLSGNFAQEGEVYRDIATGTISATGNGLKSGGYVTVLNGDGSVNLNGEVSVKYDNKTYTLQTDGRAYLGSDSSIYYVRTDTAVYNAAVAAESSIATIDLSNNATLDMRVELSENVSITSTGGTVKIGEGVVLSRDLLSTTENATTLTGSGTYALDLEQGVTRGGNVNYGSEWNGTVRLSGEAEQKVDLNAIAQRGENDYVDLELAGVVATLQVGDIQSNLQLEDLDEGYSALVVANSGEFVFRGDISGSGSIINAAYDAPSTYTFRGSDLSNWTGDLVNYGDHAYVVIDGMLHEASMGAALTFVDSVSYMGTASDDVYTVAAVETTPDGTTLTADKGTLKVASLSGIGALTVNGSVELAGGEYQGSSITLGSSDSTLTLGGVDASAAVLHANGGNVVLKADSASIAGLDGSGRVAAADSQPHTLTLNGGGNYSSSASIGANIDLEMNGSGTQTLTGDITAFTGDIYTGNGTLRLQQSNATTTVGVLNMSGGNVEFGTNKTVLDAARVVSGATAAITVQNGASVVLNRSIQNSGSLTLSGTLDVGNLTLSRMDTGFIDTAGRASADGSGFVTSSDSVRVVRNIGDGSLVADDAKADYKGEIVSISPDGLAVLNRGYAVAADTYYVRDAREDAVAYSVIAAKAVAHGGALARVAFDRADAYLTLDTQADMGVFTVEDSSVAHVEVTPGGQLNMSALSAGVDGSMLLNGAGKVLLSGRAGLARNVQLATDWQGTVTLTGSSTGVNLGADGSLWTGSGSNASTIEFNNWNGTLVPPASVDDVTQIGAKVVMNGMTLTESATGANLAFNNTITGNGTFVNNSGSDLYLELHGDISGWNGQLVTESGSTTVTLLGEQVVVNNDILMGTNGSVTVTAVSDTTFNGQVQADALVIGGGLATIASGFEVQNISCYASLAVGQGGSLFVSGDVDGLNAPVTNAGSISFAGAEMQSITLDGQAQFEFSEVHYTDKDGRVTGTGNGFRSGGTATLIEMAQGATLSGAENVIVSYRDQIYTLLDNGSFGDRYGEHTYYIHEGTVNYSDIKGLDGLVGLHLDSTLKPDATATLNLDANMAQGMTSGIVSDGGTINLASGVLLKASQLQAGASTTLTGGGLYELESGSADLGLTLDKNAWTGTVRITDATGLDKINLQSYAGTNASTVALRGVSGWIYAQQTNLNAHLMLEKDPADASNPALMLIDASSDTEYKLSVGVCGDGDYVLGFDSSKRISGTTHTFCGDVQNWTGSFIDAVAQTGQANTTTLKFLNNTAVNGVVNINANIIDRSSGADHKLNVYVDETAGRINLNGALAGIDKLTYKANGSGHVLHIADLTTNAAGTTLEFENGNHPSTIEVNNLSGSGTLSLHNNNKATGLANFAINGGDYSGERIDFTAMKSGYSDSNRCVLLTIGDGHVAEHSVIHTSINKNGGGTVNVGIAVNDDVVRVGGLADDAYNVSGTCVYSLVSGNPTGHTNPDATGFTSDGTVRTLEIVGNGGSTQAKVGADLNITMNSAWHTQSFTGDMGSFTGAIDVRAGTLNITSTGAVSLHAVNVADGGTLVLSSTSTSMAQTIANSGRLTIGGTFVLDAMDISGSSEFANGESSSHNGFLVGGPSIQVVQGASATVAEGGVTMTYKDEEGTFDATTGLCTFQGQPGTHYETFYVNASGTAESLAHAKDASGGNLSTVRLTDGTTLNMDLAGTTLNTVEVSPSASATLHVSQNATLSAVSGLEKGQTLAIQGESAAVLTLGGASSVQGDLLITHSTVKMGNIQSLGAYNRVTSIDAPLQRTIIVGEQGVLDVNGGETGSDVGYTVTLDGGTLTNTGGDKNYGKRQPVTNLILDSDSTVVAKKTFGLVASAHAATTLALNGHTLEKTGGNAFYIVNATMDAGDGGRIKVSEGMLNFNGTEIGKRGTMEGTLELAGGNVAGHIKLGGDTAFDGTAASSDVTADIDTNGHDVHFAGSGDISVHAHSNTEENGSGAISGSGSIVKEGTGTTAISGSLSGFSGSIDAQGGILNLVNQSALSVQDVVLADGATVGAYTTAAADETNEATLTISGTLAAKGADGRLNANVVMESGSTLDVRGTGGAGLLMGSEVTLNKGMMLSDYSGEWASWEVGTTYTLFTGVDGLDIGSGIMTGSMDYIQWVDAKEYFSNIEESNRYFLCYGGAPAQDAVGVLSAVNDGSNVGMIYIMTVPEPTSSTLSLLALAALAARRRRKA